MEIAVNSTLTQHRELEDPLLSLAAHAAFLSQLQNRVLFNSWRVLRRATWAEKVNHSSHRKRDLKSSTSPGHSFSRSLSELGALAACSCSHLSEYSDK